ncbi:helix-turn-helix domain-containing protein [Streptacidiphilus sp. N1-3]|uniref:Helix-turn-helix domain-containing protein n=1 Tax=Streptacidiphilus alkalitolerans TaxID=3342712 RepID=A0ABV6WYN8_9ACTN
MPMITSFGSELRRLRLEAGYTLSRLAGVVVYSKGYLSKVECGKARPSVMLARQCDAALGAGGRLQRLAGTDSSGKRTLVDRRGLLLIGAASLAGSWLTAEPVNPWLEQDLPVEEMFYLQFDQARQLGQSTDPAVVLRLVEAQTRTVIEIAVRSSAVLRQRLLLCAARFAEYTGWMAQESGDNRAALVWTEEAVKLAQSAGDRDLASYALVRRALISLYGADASETVGLAAQAQSSALPPRIRGLAAQREAQGHALAGDAHACEASLDRARTLLGSDDARVGEEPVIGSGNLVDPAAMVSGWCLYDLGRPLQAAEVLDRECSRIPPNALRSLTRYGMRRALAHAAAGEAEHACGIAAELLDISTVVRSATVEADIRKLSAQLGRFRGNRAVRDLQPVLARALGPAGG